MNSAYRFVTCREYIMQQRCHAPGRIVVFEGIPYEIRYIQVLACIGNV